MVNALAISDLQIPAEHVDALEFCKHVRKVWFPDVEPLIINMGDEFDQHTLSTKFPANPDGLSGSQELNESRIRIQAWYEAFPKTYVCMSNHTYRAWKKAAIVGIPSEFMRSIAEVYGAPVGWRWNDRWTSKGICFEHGENVSGPTAALNAAIQNQMRTVIGHQHSHAGVAYRDSVGSQLWGMNTGCLIDIAHYAFAYGKNLRVKPTLGCGVIKNSVPYFIPMILNQSGRWVKYI